MVKILSYSASLVFIALQAGIAYGWLELGVIAQFQSFFQSVYSTGVPAWSKLAFAFGIKWYGVSAILLALWLYFLVTRKNERRHTLVLILVPFCTLLLMIYAMYPIHIMANVV